jgi:hypothetical protein
MDAVARYRDASERKDIDSLLETLTDDAVLVCTSVRGSARCWRSPCFPRSADIRASSGARCADQLAGLDGWIKAGRINT